MAFEERVREGTTPPTRPCSQPLPPCAGLVPPMLCQRTHGAVVLHTSHKTILMPHSSNYTARRAATHTQLPYNSLLCTAHDTNIGVCTAGITQAQRTWRRRPGSACYKGVTLPTLLHIHVNSVMKYIVYIEFDALLTSFDNPNTRPPVVAPPPHPHPRKRKRTGRKQRVMSATHEVGLDRRGDI